MKLSRLEHTLLLSQRGPFLSPDGDGGGGGAGEGNANDANANNANSSGKSEEGKGGEEFKPITTEAELSAYKADLRKNIAADLRKSIKAELDAERSSAEEKARKKKETDDAAARGEFETAKKALETDLETAQGEAKTFKERNQALEEAMKVGVDALWKDLPEALKLAGKFIPETDILGRWTYLHDADVQKQIAEANKADPKRGNGRDPKSTGDGQPELKSLISKAAFLG